MTDAPSRPALLRATGARIVVGDAIACDGLTLQTRGQALVIAGEAAPLLAALACTPLNVAEAAERARDGDLVPLSPVPRVAGGELWLAGHDVASGAHRPRVGYAPLDPPILHDALVVDHVTDAVRLLAAALRTPALEQTADVVRGVLELASLAGARRRRLGTLAVPERRALSLALAAAGAPEVILVDRPLVGLEGEAAAFAFAAFTRVCAGRGVIARVATLAPGTPEGDLARRADDVALLDRGALTFFGAPGGAHAGSRVFQLTILSGAEELGAALAGEGLALGGGPGRYALTLPDGKGPTDVLRLAAAVRASVVEILPLL